MATLAGIYWLFTLPCVVLIPVILVVCFIRSMPSRKKDEKSKAAFREEHAHDFDYLDEVFTRRG